MRNWNVAGASWTTPLYSFQTTYEELKLIDISVFLLSLEDRFQTTYEELKHWRKPMNGAIGGSFQTTYEELKHKQ